MIVVVVVARVNKKGWLGAANGGGGGGGGVVYKMNMCKRSCNVLRVETKREKERDIYIQQSKGHLLTQREGDSGDQLVCAYTMHARAHTRIDCPFRYFI